MEFLVCVPGPGVGGGQVTPPKALPFGVSDDGNCDVGQYRTISVLRFTYVKIPKVKIAKILKVQL